MTEIVRLSTADAVKLLTPRAAAFIGRVSHKMLIDGSWSEAAAGGAMEVLNPATEELLARVPAAGPQDVERAIAAARAAFDGGPWSRFTPEERQRALWTLADLIEANAQTIAQIESLDNGKSAAVAQMVDVKLATQLYRYMAGWATKIEGATVEPSFPRALGLEVTAFIRKEPVGVVAAVVPWNFPFLITAMKLAPALAAGCTVVLKPAEQTPLSALFLGELIAEAGFPNGVVNIVTGDGPGAGAPLTSHPAIDKISFTGSTEVGKIIGKVAMDNMTRLTLELGGKSPVIVLPDFAVADAAAGAAGAIFFNHGQVCCAGSRLFVHKKIYDNVVADIGAIAEKMSMGHGLDPQAQMGPLVSAEQLERVCDYIDLGRAEGAELVAGGARAGNQGYFVRPTVLSNVADTARVSREEIFGPVLVASPFEDLDDVARRANDTPYGLGASIWSKDLSAVHRLVPKLRSGSVWVNCHSAFDAALPFGGYKQSGFGKDFGRQSLDGYLETKSVVIAL
ncbi:aldehyde dehydrogenase family protein [Xanthobacter agilis]|uniref:Phenylacetaldehyde dehydrogenase n=1 Tax=Xanthobacter agilis TaxID=47492 RepID=A0ABU0L904_XANAG|nr:aldehyde dehydrogenase family protein [Xanthobacter agilis]MDQ0503599.1 phenylacetaldehyde dehydrogenase [Xanthobacter agilis]